MPDRDVDSPLAGCWTNVAVLVVLFLAGWKLGELVLWVVVR